MAATAGLRSCGEVDATNKSRPAKDRVPFTRSIGKKLIGFLLLAVLFVGVRMLPLEQATESLKGWVGELGYWGPVVFSMIYIVATVAFFPGLILTIAAGAIFGLTTGTLAVSLGSNIGAVIAFSLSRYVARDKVAAMAARNPKFGAIDRAIEEGGWKIVALLRLSPAIPFNLQNYLYGLTRVRFWPYMLTSWIAMLPGTFLYVYVGHVAGAAVGDREKTPGEWAMMAVGLLATVAVTVYVTRLAKRQLKQQTELGDEPPQPATTNRPLLDFAPQAVSLNDAGSKNEEIKVGHPTRQPVGHLLP